jgi:hypothetical protein
MTFPLKDRVYFNLELNVRIIKIEGSRAKNYAMLLIVLLQTSVVGAQV